MKKFISLILFLISLNVFAYGTLIHFNSIDYGEDINVYYFTDVNQWNDERDEVCRKEVRTTFDDRDCCDFGPEEPELKILTIAEENNYSVIMIVNKDRDWINASVWILKDEQWNLYDYSWI